MTLKSRRFDADAALVAVRMLVGSADAADAALVTVVLPLVLVVQEHTDGTPVIPKNNTALFADLAGGLDTQTLHTSHGNDCMPIHPMRSLHILFVFEPNLVVAEPAIKELITTGG